MRVFVSYARKDKVLVETLVADLKKGHEVHFDRDNHAGQRWWDEILLKIRACDAMIFVLSGVSHESKPCLAELKYAEDLNRPILPLRVDVRVPFDAVTGFAAREQLDYATRDADSAFALSGALSRMQPGIPLPDPLPDPPPIPFSPMTRLAERVGAATLDRDEQDKLVLEFQAFLDDDDYAGDASFHLGRLLRHKDLYAIVKTKIEKLLKAPPSPPVLDVHPTVIDLGEISVGDTVSPRHVEIRNGGGGQLDWVVATASEWLTLTPEAESFTIDAEPRAGRNDATVVVTDRTSQDRATIRVSAFVASPPWWLRLLRWLRARRVQLAALGLVVVLVVVVVVVLFAGRDDDDATADGDTTEQDGTDQDGNNGDDGGQFFEQIPVPATSDWTDTGIELVGGERVEISASGEIGDNPEIPDQRFEPGGAEREDPDKHPGDPYLDFPHAALIGHIGDGEAFEVGYGTTIEDSPPGRLYLGINDGYFDDNSDKYLADITVKGQ